MKPMNRMEALLMGDKTLTPETRQEAVAQYVGEKLSGAKKRILFFENKSFSNSKKSYSISELGLTDLVNSLNVKEGNYTKILSKYRMIFHIDAGQYGYCKTVLEYDLATPNASSTYVQTPILFSDGSTVIPATIGWESAYKEIFIRGIGDVTCNVTCHIEEL